MMSYKPRGHPLHRVTSILGVQGIVFYCSNKKYKITIYYIINKRGEGKRKNNRLDIK